MLVLAACFCIHAAPAYSAPATDAERLIDEIGQRSQAMNNLEQLCDGIGPRLTGSPQLRTAQAWAMDKLTAYGASNVHEEAYELGRPWTRGPARARLLNANRQALAIVQKGWTTGTGGPVQAEVALLEARTLEQLRAAAPALKGKIVLVLAEPRANEVQRKQLALFRREVSKVISEAQFAAVLLVSKIEGGTLDMRGGTGESFDTRTGIITTEGAGLLRRLLARGVVPRLEIALGGGFGKAPVQAYNVVADLVGSELPDEMVIVGAHQDSWDLGTGATDNGAGTVIALEVMRAMHAQGLKPKRTLRIVLFSGEEQGLLGSQAYVARHRSELASIQALLMQDTGAGRIQGFPDMKVDAWHAGLTAALAPAQALGGLDAPYGLIGSSDHVTFFDQGVPAFLADQDLLDYRSHTYHSERDTVDHVNKADLIQNAQVMAVTAWGMLNGARMPHQAPVATP